MPVICEGCGQRVPIPEGHRRNKIQCACGVICVVPESERREVDAPAAKRAMARPAAAVEEEAERWLLDEPSLSPSSPPNNPPSFHDPEPIAAPAPARKPAAFERSFPCRRCGRSIRRQGECPDCDGVSVSQAISANEEPVWWPSVEEPENGAEEDASPYGVEGEDDVKCPKCCLMLPPGSVLCIRCGFHLKKRKKIARTYQPMERMWETTASYRTRLAIFSTCEVFLVITGLMAVLSGKMSLGMFLGTFLALTLMLAFLLGTFDRIHLTRDSRGRVRLTKTWRALFVAGPPQEIDVREFEGISSGQHRPVSPWDSWLLYFLLPFGIVPGIIWWYLVFHKITYHVALNRDHGFPVYQVYSGWSAIKMREIAYALRDASGLRYDEG